MLFLEVPQRGVIVIAACFFAIALLLAAVPRRFAIAPPLGSAIHSVAPPEYSSTTSFTPRPPVHRSLGEGGNPNSNPKLEVDLPVPFTAQAPEGRWVMPYEGACEEASIAMALSYALGRSSLSAGEARREILKLVRENERTLGDAIDESVSEVQALIARRAPQVATRVVHEPSASDLKQELSKGNVVLVPVVAYLLRNPHYRNPPPRYHMLVLRGYTADGTFITNEPGTEHGNGYRYPMEHIMKAMHDLPEEGDVEDGRKAVLVVEPLKAANRG